MHLFLNASDGLEVSDGEGHEVKVRGPDSGSESRILWSEEQNFRVRFRHNRTEGQGVRGQRVRAKDKVQGSTVTEHGSGVKGSESG